MKIKLLFMLITTILNYSAYGQNSLVINETMADNETTLADEDGDYSDWIELYNNGDTVLNLSGFFISDDSLNLLKWALPIVELKPDSFLLLFASGKDTINGAFYHTNFKLDSDGELLLLTDSLGNLIDEYASLSMNDDQSYGRRPDGSDHFFYFDLPSPRITNNFSTSLLCSHDRGFYTEPFLFSINSDDTSNTIYYTLDGSIPSHNSEQYLQPFWIDYRYNDTNIISEIPTTPDSGYTDIYYWIPPEGLVDKTTVLRIRSFQDYSPTSKVYNYTFIVDSNIYSKYTFPIISLITDPGNLFNHDTGIYIPGIFYDTTDSYWTGNYYQKEDEWERDVHIEFFEQSGQVGFCQNAGMKIHGKQTRRRPQKSLKIYARTSYGKKYFDYSLFPQRESGQYKHFIIKNSFGCMKNTIIKDVMTHDLVWPLGLENSDYLPVIVFINGEYWGFHTLREDQDENYLSGLYDIDKGSINLLENNATSIYGSNENYLELIEFIENNDLSIASNYNFATSKIDIENFIDYQISEIFLQNYDWPGSNIKYWQSSEQDNKWRWIFFDLDFAYFDYNFNMMDHATLAGGTSWPNPDWSTMMLRKLLENETFENQFTGRFATLLNTLFQPDNILSKIQQFTDLYEPEIDGFISRYGYPQSKANWLNIIDQNLRNFAIERPCVMQDHIMEFFDLTEFDFNCDTTNSTKFLKSDSFDLFPNPNNGHFKITMNSIGETNIEIFNSIGLSVFQYHQKTGHHSKSLSLDLSHLKNGMYLLLLKQDSYASSEKIIICK